MLAHRPQRWPNIKTSLCQRPHWEGWKPATVIIIEIIIFDPQYLYVSLIFQLYRAVIMKYNSRYTFYNV